MKICVISNYPPSTQNLSEYTYHLVKKLKNSAKINVIFVLGNKNNSSKLFEFSRKIKIIRCWDNNSFLSLFNIIKFLHHIKPDLIYFNIHMTSWGKTKIINFFGSLIPFITKLAGFKVVTTLHNITEIVDLNKVKFLHNSKINLLGGYICTKFILKSDRVTVTLNYIKEILETKYKNKNIVHIPHGSFNSEENRFYHDARKILIFGDVSPHKDYKTVIEVIKEINNARKNKINLIIAGTSHPKYLNYLEKLKKRYQCNFITYTDYIPEKEVGDIFKSSNIVVLPYKVCTGASGTLNLACSYGRSIIASNIELFRIMSKEEGQKILFYKDKRSLKKQISLLISNKKLQKSLGSQNLKIAKKFSLNNTAKKLTTVFETVLKET